MMSLTEDREQWVALAEAAQRGDAAAWTAIIDRFGDLTVAVAVGLCGDIDEASEIAQEALELAFRHLADLEDPSAFPAWLLRLVRTAANRRTRRRRFAMVSLDAPPGEACPVRWLTGRRDPTRSCSRPSKRRKYEPQLSVCRRASDASWPCTI